MNNRLDNWISKVVSEDAKKKPASQNNEKKQKSFQKHRAQQKKLSPHSKSKKSFSSPKGGKGKLRAIPLGGLNEIGRNCMCFEYGNDIILVDAGFEFPEVDMYGVDYILPDTRYVEGKKQNIRGIVITHAHLDHIGGLRYLLPKLGYPPVYAPPLSVGLIEKQLNEYPEVRKRAKIHRIDPQKDVLKLGAFQIKYFHVNHSIPDANGLYIQTPAGNVVHTGDFKFDFTPADGVPADFHRMTEIAKSGVDVVFSDSTNAQKPGFCTSEKVVAETLEQIIRDTKQGRLVITSFSSVLGRWQQIIELAGKYDRKIYVTGRSLLENLKIAADRGYIKVPQGRIHKVTKRMHDVPRNKQLIITTGAQGEENAGLSRISRGEHHMIKLEKGDSVIFSSSPIPGNERQMTKVIDALYKLGAKVITNRTLDTHTTGHACQGDLKLMYALLKPTNIVPVHGEFHMRVDHARMVREDLGYESQNVAVISNGDILEILHGKIQKSREKAPGERIFVDGKMVGDIGNDVLEDRKAMMKSGVVSFTFAVDKAKRRVYKSPNIQSLGFTYPHERERLMETLKKESITLVNQVLSKYPDPRQKGGLIRRDIEKKLSGKIVKLTEREPRVLITLVVN